MSYNYPPDQPGQYPPQQPGAPVSSPNMWGQPFPSQLPPNAQPTQQWNPQPQMQQPYPYPPAQPYPAQQQQPMYAPQQPMPVPMMQTNVNVNLQQKSGPGLLVRAIYFVFIGWWFGYLWLIIGFSLCALILTLPLGLIMLNRLPRIMTLKQPASGANVNVSTSTVAMQPMMGAPGPAMMVQNINVNVNVGTQQHSFLLRAIYFIFVGSWVGLLWAHLAYACCVSILLLPVGVMMFDRLPAVLTLRKG